MKINVKTIIICAIILFISATFYYITEARDRLKNMEQDILFLDRQVYNLKREDKRLNRLILKFKKDHMGWRSK